MIIVIDLIKNLFIIMFLTLMALEFITLISLTSFYKKPIMDNESSVEELAFSTTTEILNSFNHIIIRKYYGVQTDLLLIAKHLYPMYLTQEIEIQGNDNENKHYPRFTASSDFYSSFSNCLVKGSEFESSVVFLQYNPQLPSTQFPDFKLTEKLIAKNKNFTEMTEEKIIQNLSAEPGLDKISYYPEFVVSNNRSDLMKTYACYAISMMKTLQIKNFIFEKNNQITQSYYLFLNDYIFKYPADFLNITKISELPYFTRDPQCADKYTFQCSGVINLMDQESYIFFENPKIWNDHLISRGCIGIQFSKENPTQTNAACIYVNLDNVLKDVYTAKDSVISLSLLVRDENLTEHKIFYTSHSGFRENAKKLFNSPSLKEYQLLNNSTEYSLFHTLYYDIFKELYNSTTGNVNINSDSIEIFFKQYEKIREYLTNNITSFEMKPKACAEGSSYARFSAEKSYLLISEEDTQMNTTSLKTDTFQFLLSPICINFTYYNRTNFAYSSQPANTLAFYSLSVVRVGSQEITSNIYLVLILKCFRSWIFFAALLLFSTIVFYIAALIYIKKLLYPIKDIKKNLEAILIKDKNQKPDELQKSLEKIFRGEKGNDSSLPSLDQSLFSNQETKSLDRLVNFLKRIIVLNQTQGKLNFKNQRQIFNRFLNNLSDPEHKRQCELIIAIASYKEKNFVDAYTSLDNLKHMLENEEAEIIGKNDAVEQKIINLPSQLKSEDEIPPYFNEFTDNERFDPDINKFIRLRIFSQKIYYLYGLIKYLDFINGRKEIMNEKISNEEKKLKLHDPEYITLLDQSISWLQKAISINSTMNINQIKSIFILILVSKCYYYMDEQIEAANYLKEALLKLTEMNKYFYDKNLSDHVDPRVMFVTNGLIIEHILFNLGKVCNKLGKKQLSGWIFNRLMELTYYRTDEIQRKSCKRLNKFLKDKQSINVLPSKFLLEKICKRLDKPPMNKEVCIIVSENLLKNFNSTYELREVLIKCIQNYICENDIISYFQFDTIIQKETIIPPVSKYSNMKLFEQSTTFCKYSGNIMSLLPKEKSDFSGALRYAMQLLTQNDIFYSKRDTDVYDKYIFAFIFSEDFRFNSAEENRELSKILIENTASLYTFLLDDDVSQKKISNIKNYLSTLVEGFVLRVTNFKIIKQAFQNISVKGTQKNILQSNYENHNYIL